MSVKCNHCKQSITTLKPCEANIITSGKYHVPAVLITLVCPHCSQHYYAEVPVMEFIPCEEK
ncbi:hypothetical protein CYG68_21225 [Morganella morganii]|uniref:Uncharacterized protein n=1 Tax=Morganella morganii TaxID=582 RepID=A0A8I0Q8Y8_MORMO|nr:hypothetical protein [Morganella morganii]